MAIALGGVCAVGFLTSVIFVVYKNRKRLYRKHKRQPHTFTPVSTNTYAKIRHTVAPFQ